MTETIKPNGTARKNGQPADTLSHYVFGKTQPQALELETAVLGALLIDREIYEIVSDILRPEAFYLEANQHVYRAIQTLQRQSKPVDLLTVTEHLRASGSLEKAGGGHYLVEISHRVASAANTEYHARIIEQKHIARSVIEICTRAVSEAYQETTDVFDMLDTLESAISKVRVWQGKQEQTFGVLGGAILRDLEERAAAKDGLSGVPTGLIEYDRKTGGLQKTDLICIGARPGMGKSALMLTIALNAAKFGKSVGIFSLEMSALQLAKRVAAMEGRINSEKMRSGKLDDAEWLMVQQTVEKLSALNVVIDDTPGIDLYELRSKARKFHKRYGLDILLIDYLQLITLSGDAAKGKNRDQVIGEISRSLKALAKELDIPVVMLSQLSRAVETRGGSKRPVLSDLRESGNVEQDCDLITFIYRPEYYGITADEEGNNLAGVAELINAKNRHGETGYITTKWKAEHALFCDENDFDNIVPQPFDFTLPASAQRRNEEDIPF